MPTSRSTWHGPCWFHCSWWWQRPILIGWMSKQVYLPIINGNGKKEFAPVSLSLILGLLEVIAAVMLTQTGFWSVPLPALVIAATLSFWLIVPG